MELKSSLEQLGLLQKKLYAYQTASSSLYLDSVTVAPKDTSEGRGVALGILAGESQKLITAPETGELLAFLADQKENLSFVEQRQVEELKRSYDRLSRIPADEYMDYAMLTNEASDVWHRAKESSDFTLFAPVLEKLVAYNRKFAGYYDSSKSRMMHCWMNMNAVRIWLFWIHFLRQSGSVWYHLFMLSVRNHRLMIVFCICIIR